jgi:protein-S-isoprenylcysteine O-methyltransferase Ste14
MKTSYQRIFGAGPRGLAISVLLLVLTVWANRKLHLPSILAQNSARYAVFAVLTIMTVSIILWSVKSLPPANRGTALVTRGVFRYMRHPLYGAFLCCFDFGLAVLLNSWLYVLWAIVQLPVWHWNIGAEEALMRQAFPGEYDAYCRVTGRFFPRLWSKTFWENV